MNDKGDPKLYLSHQIETALAEVDAQTGDLFQAVGLIHRDDAFCTVTIVGEQHHVLRTGYLRHFGYDPKSVIQKSLISQGEDQSLRICFADSVLAEVLADPSARHRGYVSSRTLCDELLRRSPRAKGILYPSVKHDLGSNLALVPDIDACGLKVVCIPVIAVHAARPNGYYDIESIGHFRIGDNGTDLVRMHGVPQGIEKAYFNISKDEATRMEINEATS